MKSGLLAFLAVVTLCVKLLAACPEPAEPLDLGELPRRQGPAGLRPLDPSVLRPLDLSQLRPLAQSPLQPVERAQLGAPVGFDLKTPWRTPGAPRIALDDVVDALDPIVADLNAKVRLPRAVPIEFLSCGNANAFYDPAVPRIVLCDELVAVLDQELARSYGDDGAGLVGLRGAVAFALLHEISHAYFGELRIANTGNAESAADTMAAVLLLEHGGATIAAAGADAFLALDDWKARTGRPLAFWDEHAFDVQRFYDLTCLIYGSDPGRFGFLLADQILPWERAQVCPSRYRDNVSSVAAQLALR